MRVATHGQVAKELDRIFWFAMNQHAILPLLQENLLFWPLLHLTLPVLLVLVELASVDRMVRRGKGAFTISHVILPLALISVLFASEYFTEAMSFVSFPLAYIQIFIIVIAVALTFTKVLLPFTVVLIIGPLLLISTIEHAIPIANVSSIDEHLALIVITIAVGVLRHDSVRVHLLHGEVVPISAGHRCRH